MSAPIAGDAIGLARDRLRSERGGKGADIESASFGQPPTQRWCLTVIAGRSAAGLTRRLFKSIGGRSQRNARRSRRRMWHLIEDRRSTSPVPPSCRDLDRAALRDALRLSEIGATCRGIASGARLSSTWPKLAKAILSPIRLARSEVGALATTRSSAAGIASRQARAGERHRTFDPASRLITAARAASAGSRNQARL